MDNLHTFVPLGIQTDGAKYVRLDRVVLLEWTPKQVASKAGSAFVSYLEVEQKTLRVGQDRYIHTDGQYRLHRMGLQQKDVAVIQEAWRNLAYRIGIGNVIYGCWGVDGSLYNVAKQHIQEIVQVEPNGKVWQLVLDYGGRVEFSVEKPEAEYDLLHNVLGKPVLEV